MDTTVSLDRPVTEFMANSAVTLRETLTIDQALAALRASPVTDTSPSNVIYFYVVNDESQFVGVLPSRRLILSPAETKIGDLMLREVVSLRPQDTLFDALELFAMHRLLAIPVVDAEKRLMGLVELSVYTDEVFDFAHTRQLNEVFQLMGLRLEQHKQGSPWRGFRLRMPWLVSNIVGGLICAALGSFFEATVQRVVVIALFIPLVLTLAESVSVQSMTLAIEQAMQKKSYPRLLAREIATALLLGICSGVIVGLVSLLWRGPRAASLTIAAAVAVTMLLAAIMGRIVPKVIYLLKLNPRIASGPITLAAVDVVTVCIYLAGATMILGG